MLTVTYIFLIAAIILTITSAIPNFSTPLWAGVICLCVVVALMVLPK